MTVIFLFVSTFVNLSMSLGAFLDMCRLPVNLEMTNCFIDSISGDCVCKFVSQSGRHVRSILDKPDCV